MVYCIFRGISPGLMHIEFQQCIEFVWCQQCLGWWSVYIFLNFAGQPASICRGRQRRQSIQPHVWVFMCYSLFDNDLFLQHTSLLFYNVVISPLPSYQSKQVLPLTQFSLRLYFQNWVKSLFLCGFRWDLRWREHSTGTTKQTTK